MRNKRFFIFLILCGCLLLVTGHALSASHEAIAEKIEGAFTAKKPYPLVSQQIKGLTVDQAHEIQAAVVRLREEKGGVVMGYKGGLWSPRSQKMFGLKSPVYMPLFKSMLRWPGIIYRRNFMRMVVEMEIGFRFGRDITEPVNDMKSLRRSVAIVYPAIELADWAFKDPRLAKGLDLIATNGASRKVLIGKAAKAKDLNAITPTLFYNGQKIASGIGRNAAGDQWKALKWIVNNVLARGGKVKNGYVVITGSLSKPVPGKPGKYLADYGDFGKMDFEIK